MTTTRRPSKAAQPRRCSRGSPATRRSTSDDSADPEAADVSSAASSSAKTQPAARSRETTGRCWSVDRHVVAVGEHQPGDGARGDRGAAGLLRLLRGAAGEGVAVVVDVVGLVGPVVGHVVGQGGVVVERVDVRRGRGRPGPRLGHGRDRRDRRDRLGRLVDRGLGRRDGFRLGRGDRRGRPDRSGLLGRLADRAHTDETAADGEGVVVGGGGAVVTHVEAHRPHPGEGALGPGRGLAAVDDDLLAVTGGGARPSRSAHDDPRRPAVGRDEDEAGQVAQARGDQRVEHDVEAGAVVDEGPQVADPGLLRRRQQHGRVLAEDGEPVAGAIAAQCQGGGRGGAGAHGSAPSFSSRLRRWRSES